MATNLILVQATPEQTKIADERNFAAWGHLLTQEQHVARQNMLNDHMEFTGENYSAWVLVPADDPTTTNFYSACEIFGRPCLVKTVGGAVEECVSYTIAGVFTPPEYRGKGYATTMMGLLKKQLADLGASMSSLYSDVGPNFYSRHGWKVYSHRELQFSSEPRGDTAATEPIGSDQIPAISARDCELLRLEMEKYDGSQIAIAIPPSHPCLLWFCERIKYNAKTVGLTVPTIWGARMRSSSTDDFVIWSHEHKDSELTILRLRSASPAATRALVAAAWKEAAAHGLKKVIAWDANEIVHDFGNDEVKVVDRTHSLPSLVYYDGDEKESVKWILNERYAWC